MLVRAQKSIKYCKLFLFKFKKCEIKRNYKLFSFSSWKNTFTDSFWKACLTLGSFNTVRTICTFSNTRDWNWFMLSYLKRLICVALVCIAYTQNEFHPEGIDSAWFVNRARLLPLIALAVPRHVRIPRTLLANRMAHSYSLKGYHQSVLY